MSDKPQETPAADIGLGGYLDVEVINKDGTIANKFRCKNGVTTAGLTHILATQFDAGTQVTSWYFGLINNSGFSALSAADTMGSHAGWSELGTSSSDKYDETTRQQWVLTAAAAAASSDAAATFTINATVAVYGVFITSSSTKGGTTGTLWATAAFPAVQNLVDDQTLKVTYTVSATAS